VTFDDKLLRAGCGILTLGFAAWPALLAAQAGPIGYSTEHVVSATDSEEMIAERAAKVLPRPNQSAWMRLEQTYFIHFGPNTFRGVEWGNGRESPTEFNPSALDADQWVRTIKDAGGTMVILVAKHHEGMSLWPTRYSRHSVAASPWRDGKGDLVKEVADAARRHGLKLGIYLSPADLWQLKTNPANPAGYYGNGSAKVASVIPTDPAAFTSDPAQGREAAPGFGRHTYVVNDYNRYFLNQLYELLTEYGPVHEVWFDGANPDPSVAEAYDYNAWYDLIRRLQPQAVIFGKGPDARWVGNEGGVGRTTEWSVVPLPASPDRHTWPDMTDGDLGSRSKLVPGSHLWWYPAEVNTSILHGWFWAHGKAIKSSPELIDVYYQSVGRNGNMLLNLAPDTRGLIPEDQIANLQGMAKVVGRTFARNLAAGATVTADSSIDGRSAAMTMDGDVDSWWEAAPGLKQAAVTLSLLAPVTFDVVALQEAVDRRGQRIESFAVDVWDGSGWNQVDAQTTVGYKRLLRWASPVTSDRVRIRILGSRLEPTLAEVGLFKQAEVVAAPSISDRAADGAITIVCRSGQRILYTTRAETVVPQSPVYSGPIFLPRGGHVSAACQGPDGVLGLTASKQFPGFVPTGWELASASDVQSSGTKAIDGNDATIWEQATANSPRSLTVDMKRPYELGGFFYLPRRDGKPDGVVETYRFETSADGQTWSTLVDGGRFDNIRNNPVLQEVSFPAVTARFFRFTALSAIDGNGQVSAAEVGVLPAE
jgi:alpha-L-fucosidase